MTNVKQILIVLGVSVVLLGLIGWWVSKTNQAPEVLLDSKAKIDAPLSPEELKTDNPKITNTMNRIAEMKTNKG